MADLLNAKTTGYVIPVPSIENVEVDKITVLPNNSSSTASKWQHRLKRSKQQQVLIFLLLLRV